MGWLSWGATPCIAGKSNHSNGGDEDRINLHVDAGIERDSLSGVHNCEFVRIWAEMRQLPDLVGLPVVQDAFLRPWVATIESTGLGMGDRLTTATADALLSLNRRVDMTASISGAVAEARTACDLLVVKLNRNAPASNERKVALAALAVLIDALRNSKPSDSTKALGLGW